SALVVSPCVTPPLIGALIYIAESGNLWLGGGALFMLGLGMGVPLILFAVFGIHVLPKQGPWLRLVKIIFAVLLIGLAISLITRILPDDFMQEQAVVSPSFNYILVKNIDDLQQQLTAAKAQNQAVILDFYATWCVSCVKMEKTVFPDPKVQALLQHVRVLKADVSQNDAKDKALQQKFNVYGPPAFVFFSPDGQEQPDFQWAGEINAKDFAQYLEKWLATH
ncbi:MAG TPA: thioredoxin family protein, partial [Gammaproteobacteria bacterium]|nr:thioredoxin family protein [Gammaproteobacteria bacterium]